MENVDLDEDSLCSTPQDTVRKGDESQRKFIQSQENTKGLIIELAKIEEEESLMLTNVVSQSKESNKKNSNEMAPSLKDEQEDLIDSKTSISRIEIEQDYYIQQRKYSQAKNNSQKYLVHPVNTSEYSHRTSHNSKMENSMHQYSQQQKSAFGQQYKQQQKKGINQVWKKQGNFLAKKLILNTFYILGFFIFKWLIQFKLNLLQRIPSRKFEYLNKIHFDMLNDKSSYYGAYKYSSRFNKDKPTKLQSIFYFFFLCTMTQLSCILSPIRNFFRKFNFLIMPDSVFKLVWDTSILLLLIINIFYIPIKIAFYGGTRGGDSNRNSLISPWLRIFFDDIPQWAFLFDIIMNFNTSIYKRGKLVRDRKSIAQQYIKGRFFWDFIVVTPYLISIYLSVPYVDAILLLRQKKIRIIIRQYEELINLRNNKLAIYKLCKLVLFILFVGHFSGCLFYFLADIEIKHLNSKQTWLHKYDLIEKDNIDQYVSSFYWAVISITTVGYGDIIPQTTLERLFVIVITLISCGVFAYSVNQIGNIVGSMTERQENFRKQMATLTTYMRKRQVDKELQLRVKNYFQYLHQENIEESNLAESLLDQLCGSLKSEVKNHIFFQVLNNKKEFRLNFSEPFLTKLSQQMQEKILGPEETIFECQGLNKNINIILKGSVNLYIQTPGQKELKIVKKLSKGEMFGQQSFFSGQPALAGARTKNVCTIMQLSKTVWLETLKDFPLDYEKFCHIKDQIRLNCDQVDITIQCFVCNSFKHQLTKCHFINYIPHRDRLLYQFHLESAIVQERGYWDEEKKIKRKKLERNGEKTNSRLNQYLISSKAFQFILYSCDPEDFDEVLANFEQYQDISPYCNISPELQQQYSRRLSASTILGESPLTQRKRNSLLLIGSRADSLFGPGNSQYLNIIRKKRKQTQLLQNSNNFNMIGNNSNFHQDNQFQHTTSEYQNCSDKRGSGTSSSKFLDQKQMQSLQGYDTIFEQRKEHKFRNEVQMQSNNSSNTRKSVRSLGNLDVHLNNDQVMERKTPRFDCNKNSIDANSNSNTSNPRDRQNSQKKGSKVQSLSKFDDFQNDSSSFPSLDPGSQNNLPPLISVKENKRKSDPQTRNSQIKRNSLIKKQQQSQPTTMEFSFSKNQPQQIQFKPKRNSNNLEVPQIHTYFGHLNGNQKPQTIQCQGTAEQLTIKYQEKQYEQRLFGPRLHLQTDEQYQKNQNFQYFNFKGNKNEDFTPSSKNSFNNQSFTSDDEVEEVYENYDKDQQKNQNKQQKRGKLEMGEQDEQRNENEKDPISQRYISLGFSQVQPHQNQYIQSKTNFQSSRANLDSSPTNIKMSSLFKINNRSVASSSKKRNSNNSLVDQPRNNDNQTSQYIFQNHHHPYLQQQQFINGGGSRLLNHLSPSLSQQHQLPMQQQQQNSFSNYLNNNENINSNRIHLFQLQQQQQQQQQQQLLPQQIQQESQLNQIQLSMNLLVDKLLKKQGINTPKNSNNSSLNKFGNNNYNSNTINFVDNIYDDFNQYQNLNMFSLTFESIPHFESVKEYKKYFPKHNLSYILQNLQNTKQEQQQFWSQRQINLNQKRIDNILRQIDIRKPSSMGSSNQKIMMHSSFKRHPKNRVTEANSTPKQQEQKGKTQSQFQTIR